MGKLIVVFLAVAASSSAFGEDLMSIYGLAVGQDSILGSAKAGFDATKEAIPQAQSRFLPTFSAQVDAQRNWNNQRFDDVTLNETRNYSSYGAGLIATQSLFNLENFAIRDQAKARVHQGQIQWQSANQDLIWRVANAYFNVLIAEGAVSTQVAQKRATEQQVREAQRRYETGTGSITELQQSQAVFHLNSRSETVAKTQADVAKKALIQLIGREPGPLNRLIAPVQIAAPEPNDLQPWVDQAMRSSPAVLAAAAGVDIAAHELQRTKYSFYPRIDLQGNIGWDNQGAANVLNPGFNSRSSSVGIYLNWDIYSGGLRRSLKNEAGYRKVQAQYDLQTVKEEVAQQTRAAFLSVNSGLASIAELELAVEASRRAADSTRLEWEVGLKDMTDVLDAQHQLYETQNELIEAYYSTLLSHLQLKALVGQLSVAELEKVNAVLRP